MFPWNLVSGPHSVSCVFNVNPPVRIPGKWSLEDKLAVRIPPLVHTARGGDGQKALEWQRQLLVLKVLPRVSFLRVHQVPFLTNLPAEPVGAVFYYDIEMEVR